MPLVPHLNTPIEVEVSDRIYNGTIFKQKACFNTMHIEQNRLSGICSVLVRVFVSLYANDNGTYGELIIGKGISGYDVTLVADNNCAVNPQTGEVLYVRANETQEDWLALLNGKDEPLMFQGDFFEMLMHSQPVEIEPMLRGFMLQADQAPFNKFV